MLRVRHIQRPPATFLARPPPSECISCRRDDANINVFAVEPSIPFAARRTAGGTRGRHSSVGSALIQIPFQNRRVVIDLDVLLLVNDIAIRLVMRDIVNNGLDVSIQRTYITPVSRRQNVKYLTYLLVVEWELTGMSNSLNTERVLKTIQYGCICPYLTTCTLYPITYLGNINYYIPQLIWPIGGDMPM